MRRTSRARSRPTKTQPLCSRRKSTTVKMRTRSALLRKPCPRSRRISRRSTASLRNAASKTEEEETMQVGQVMTNTVTFVTPDASLPDIARKMRDEDFGAVPVAEQDRLVGMITDRDIVVRCIAQDVDVR